MMKTHLLVDCDSGLSACGRNTYDNYLLNADDIEEVDCKICIRITKRAGDGNMRGDIDENTIAREMYDFGTGYKRRV